MENLTKQVLVRFFEAGISGALAMAATVTYFTGIQTWGQLQMALNALAISFIVGFISGVLMAIRKYYKGPTVPADSVTSTWDA